ncbi:tRNA-splicing ligase RtcB [Hungatella effluvii]|uniref:tRNA-splicing ligase RtcB n=1 Tax=Hungatella effluvii TaxID=1096246 RepID=A0A2V3Y593_9FIRM|nr:RtcB family protein [Hungatella effluvii]PXX52987.1 tRNA-splicing ligase RtcB [Hungatella effluvii]
MELKIEFGSQSCGVSLFLPEGTKPDKKAMDELRSMMQMECTVERMKAVGSFFENPDSAVRKAAVTPDFHKGAGIPIGTVLMTEGFVIPQAMGNDINCGMRLYTTDLKEEELERRLSSLLPEVRRIFFEGGRGIAMNGIQREAMLKDGLTGLLETSGKAAGKGIWRFYNREEQEKELEYTAFHGSLKAGDTEGLGDFTGDPHFLSYDDQIGSIGGGNHFVEMQRVAEIYDGQTANAWGIRKGAVLIMIHTGSLTIGHQSGRINQMITKGLYPRGIPHPDNGIYLLPERGGMDREWRRFCDTTRNAANFGFANRLFLGLMLQNAVENTVRAFGMKLLYDSPHNFIWEREAEGRKYYIHRKGACSARGMEEMEGTPFAYYGEPVMIPGSMGSSSYLLRGIGNPDALWSASHGAGRRLSRGEAIHGSDEKFQEFMKKFHVITPIDPNRSDLKGRSDILKKWEESIRSEAPYAYKDIDKVVKVHENHEMAGLVARMEPLFTVKA